MKTGLHTNAQCKIKLKGINTTMEQISLLTIKEGDDTHHLANSAIEMCKELLRELKDEEDTD
jgi:hypothetical protein